ncbi:MAG TPA: PQQ-dependent sugar dehydrogenase, partial [Flavobacterium sp.]
MKKFTLLFCLTTFFSLAQTISITPFATGLSSVVGIFHAGDSRLFVVQQTGAIRIVQPNGTVDPTNFLTLTTATISTGGERGLLGLAFHPDYDTNGYFYVNYTRAGDGATVIARYTRSSSNPNIADPSTAAVLLTVAQPFSNHNGGTIAFGPDGYLYIGMGDGGSAGDPGNRAQNINENLGKMLRIDVDSGAPYAIPADNPYVGIPGNDEIWAIGLRNPWKWSFDRLTGDLYIADVGQGEYEEINRVSSTDPGVNYGWKCYEGSDVYSACTGTGVTFTFPVAEYSHSGTGGCSITGGYVYRGTTYPNFVGKYFFADYCLPRIGMMDETNNLTYSANFTGVPNFTTFGEDVTGELYVGGDDTIYKITDASLGTNQNLKNGFALYPNP